MLRRSTHLPIRKVVFSPHQTCRHSSTASSFLKPADTFERRHLGSTPAEVDAMLKYLGLKSMDELIRKTVPSSILLRKKLNIEHIESESEMLKALKKKMSKNQIFDSLIGMGFYNTHTPPVILRNILENPGWYTQYTPYQPEISQGRLESLLNYQTMVCDLTGLPVANCSLLDEGTAAAEALSLMVAAHGKGKTIFVDQYCHPQTIALIKTRAEPFEVRVLISDYETFKFSSDVCGAIVQNPNTHGSLLDLSKFCADAHQQGSFVAVGTDLLALTKLSSPGSFGADIAFGNSQRFGVPLGYGGPHAAFFSCTQKLTRRVPGRIVGVSKDSNGVTGFRLALQTREQHIRREKATSNICTAQALLANISAMYAVYHGPQGLLQIADRVHLFSSVLALAVTKLGHKVENQTFFDTLRIRLEGIEATQVKTLAESNRINFRYFPDGCIGISMDECVTESLLRRIISVLSPSTGSFDLESLILKARSSPFLYFPNSLVRKDSYLQHAVFNNHHTESEMLRYIKFLENRDLSLCHSMIPLGSCTMKLNATSELMSLTWPEVGNIHPYVPLSQSEGYQELFRELEKDLCELTGYDAVSLQPNSGANGEYTGLRAIRAYHIDIGESHRKTALIPRSAHGTNPASAHMAGYNIVVVDTDADGNVDVEQLRVKAERHKDTLAVVMITYPSTHGVFEERIREICDIVHGFGGQVYLDGANMNAQVGLCYPGLYGADVSHFNLHKTFCIPHGGGGPGMGPIGVKSHLAPYLPGHAHTPCGGPKSLGTVSNTGWGSASILPISWAYIRMMGGEGLSKASELAILNANYMAKRLEKDYDILYRGKNGFVAHEFILNVARLEDTSGIRVVDIAKRLQDYGFHGPTMSWPVITALMIEPTESEPKEELDRYCDSLLAIRKEIQEIESGAADREDNVLKHAPHSLQAVLTDDWNHQYSREKASYPVAWLRRVKFWPVIGRIDDVYGDRNLVCSCPSVTDYE